MSKIITDESEEIHPGPYINEDLSRHTKEVLQGTSTSMGGILKQRGGNPTKASSSSIERKRNGA